MTFKEYYKENRPHGIYAFLAVLLIVIISTWVSFVIFRPMPPKTVVMVTGPEGGTYRQIGEQYREIFSKAGIDLQLIPTTGSIENLAQLNNQQSGAFIGILQGGISNAEDSPDLVTLGTIFREPLWVFCRKGLRCGNLERLRGKQISIGPEGSGTRAISLELFARSGVDEQFASLLPLTMDEAGTQLINGKIDAAVMLTSWRSPVIRKLLVDHEMELVNSTRADAYVALFSYLEKIVVPTGIVSLAKNRPAKDITLLATRASLVVRKELHPAIKYLLLDAADQINSKADISQRAGEFPASESIDFPLSKEARQFYKTGRPFFQRYLPFGLAVQVHRLLVIFIPLIGLTYPLIKFVTLIYDWRMRRRIYMLYGELHFLELNLESNKSKENVCELIKQLDSLEEKAERTWLPKAYVGSSYRLREHIALVRDRLNKENFC